MTENARPAARALPIVALVLAVLSLGCGSSRTLVPGGGNGGATFDPLAYRPGQDQLLSSDAAAGFSHVIYAKSPGGVFAAARRTARFRREIEAAARRGPIDAATLEAIVMLESAGRPDVVAGPDPSAAAGLTQIVAQTGSSLLGMHIDLSASRRLGHEIARALAARQTGRAARLRARRAQIDQRFDPRAALGATERYLTIAEQTLGRPDLTVVSYHMGIGNLETALRLYTGASRSQSMTKLISADGLSYARLYFDSTPLRHAPAYRWLAALGDDSSNYLWRVRAAQQIMSLYRHDPSRLLALSRLQTAAGSAELVLRPPQTPRYSGGSAVSSGRADGSLATVPSGARGRSVGLRAVPGLALRPDALSALLYIAAGVRAIAHLGSPLDVTGAALDEASLRAQSQAAGAPNTRRSGDGDPLHATGFAFDIARRYASPAQATAFQFILDRLQALNVIAWQRLPRIIHVVVGPSGQRLRGIIPGH